LVWISDVRVGTFSPAVPDRRDLASRHHHRREGVITVSDDIVTVLGPDECWQMLREEEFGRLAFRLVDEVHITPINYAVDHDTLLFRTTGGNKLLSVAMGSEVAFEVDQYDEDHARSVVVRGSARILGEDEEHRAENLPLRPWVGTLKYNVVEITPKVVTGRAFHLSRPWLHLTIHE
jgi:nitroimidazol reductase NimA-like FMN-containing flavoprotein (pyridoxamine 5'-phosphate oxidase superfamily)